MDNDEHRIARGLLDEVYPDPDDKIRQAVTALLSVWTRVDVPLTPEQRDEAVAAFHSLALKRPLARPEGPDDSNRVWGPASQYAGSANHVRVKLDAVPEGEQWKYAGRIGEIVGIRRGYITMVFLDARDGAPPGHQGPAKDFEVDITHLAGGPAMIVNYNAQFRAADMKDAVRIATKRWQDIVGDAEAELPWGANITIRDDWEDDRLKDGKHVELNISTDYQGTS